MTEVNDNNFEELVLNSTLPALIDFTASWCGTCKMLAPVIDQVKTEFLNKVLVHKIDVEANPETAAKYGIKNIPAMLFIKNGEVVDKIVGATPKSKIIAKINDIL
jgi:thioredoxin 1